MPGNGDLRWKGIQVAGLHGCKPSNVIANTLKLALAGKHKLLLTATPLQNSLLELFGLVSFIDEHTFGDMKSFREQFANLNQDQVFQTLKARLKPVCHRTLRRQVKDARRAATTALTLEEKLAGQKQIKSLEALRNLKRRSLFDAQDQVDQQREELIAAIEGKMNQHTRVEKLFSIRWAIA